MHDIHLPPNARANLRPFDFPDPPTTMPTLNKSEQLVAIYQIDGEEITSVCQGLIDVNAITTVLSIIHHTHALWFTGYIPEDLAPS